MAEKNTKRNNVQNYNSYRYRCGRKLVEIIHHNIRVQNIIGTNKMYNVIAFELFFPNLC